MQRALWNKFELPPARRVLFNFGMGLQLTQVVSSAFISPLHRSLCPFRCANPV